MYQTGSEVLDLSSENSIIEYFLSQTSYYVSMDEMAAVAWFKLYDSELMPTSQIPGGKLWPW